MSPIAALVALAVGVLVTLMSPQEVGAWVILVSALAWLNATLAVRGQGRATTTPSSSNLALLGGLASGMAIGAPAVVVLGAIGIAVGLVASTVAVLLLTVVLRPRAADDRHPQRLITGLVSPVATGISLALLSVLGRLA